MVAEELLRFLYGGYAPLLGSEEAVMGHCDQGA